MLEINWHLPALGDIREPSEGPATIEFYLHTPAGDFPQSGWEDVGLVIMAAWMALASGALSHANRLQQYLLPFEGEYVLETDIAPSGIAVLRFVSIVSGMRAEIMPPLELPLREMCHTLLGTGQAMLAACRASQFGNEAERAVLEKNIERLQSALAL